MARTLYLVDIEAVDTRYTAQWRKFLPNQLKRYSINVKLITSAVTQVTTPGAFLNFSGTNSYKSD